MRIATHPTFGLQVEEKIYIKANRKIRQRQRSRAIVERWKSLPFYQEISEEFARALNDNGLLTEGKVMTGKQLIEAGFFDALQGTVGNGMGAITGFFRKVGLKKEPKDYEETQQLFQKVVANATDKKVSDFLSKLEDEIKKLEIDSGSKETNANFPYNRTASFFVNGVCQIAVFYESLKAAVEKGEMTALVANQFIRQLRIAVEKYIKECEREKGGLYTKVGTGDIKAGDVKVGSTKGPYESKQLRGRNLYSRHSYDINKMSLDRLLYEIKMDEAQLTDEQLKAFEEKVSDPEYKATLEKYSSMTGPKILAMLGIGTAALGFLANSQWFIDIVKNYFTTVIKEPDTITNKTEEVDDLTKPITKNLFDLQSGGPGKTLKAMGIDDPDIIAIADGTKRVSSEEYIAAMDKADKLMHEKFPDFQGQLGATTLFQNYDQIRAGLAKFPKMNYIAAMEKLGFHDSTRGTGKWANFTGAAKPSGKVPQLITGYIKKKITKQIVNIGATTATISSTGTAVLGTMATVAPVLAGVGVAAVATAAVWALWRNRVKTKSRVSVLTDLKRQLVDLPEPPQEVEPKGEAGDVEVEIELKDPPKGGQAPVGNKMPSSPDLPDVKGAKKEGKYSISKALFENTLAVVKGLEGDNVDPKGTSVTLPTVDGKKFPPNIDNPDDLPSWVTKQIEKSLDGLDMNKAKVKVKDSRTEKSDPKKEKEREEKPEPIVPPVPVPKPSDNKSFAVAVFTGPKGVQVYRVLKKNTLSRYKSGASSAGDKKSADIFKGMIDKYDASINALKAAGLYVNDKKLQTALGNISTGKDGNKIKFDYAKGGKNIKSKTGGFTQMKSAKNVEDIKNNILGADGKKVKDVGKLSIVYLVGNSVMQSVAKSAKVDTEKAREIIAKVIKMWAKNKKAPKADSLKIDDDGVKSALKKNGLVESVNRDYSVITVDTKMFVEALREIKEQQVAERMNILAGVA